jgi:exosortase D (VPLPA-CTERM-specific)
VSSDPRAKYSAPYRFPVWVWALLLALAAMVGAAFGKAILFMVGQWGLDEFSHGYLIPFISAYLIWQRRPALQRVAFRGSWLGVAVAVFGAAIDVAGRLSALFVLQHIGFVVVIIGFVLALVGRPAFRILAAPLAILIFMVPLPNMLLNSLSSELQLLSSSIGVAFMRQLGMAVLLEGNVIDLGNYKLEVAQACSGLRYLFPLMTLAFLIACFYRTAFWKRAIIFLSSIPITLLMNSLRIAMIGVMVDRWGVGMAEGALHEVQGWMMFMLSGALLLLEVVLLTRVGRQRRPWREVFGVASEPRGVTSMAPTQRGLPAPAWAAGVFLALFSIAALAIPTARLDVPARESFASFPLQLDNWSGKRQIMDKVYLDQLKLDDYLLADYTAANGSNVNLYVAWYDAQTAGEATHSPRACLPGGGWRIIDLRRAPVRGVSLGGMPLTVNRALIEYGDQRELVYYWFMQRGRVITNEYLVKWYLLVDALLRHRTDGALVRLIVPLPNATAVPEADRRLQRFAAAVVPQLAPYVPG